MTANWTPEPRFVATSAVPLALWRLVRLRAKNPLYEAIRVRRRSSPFRSNSLPVALAAIQALAIALLWHKLPLLAFRALSGGGTDYRWYLEYLAGASRPRFAGLCFSLAAGLALLGHIHMRRYRRPAFLAELRLLPLSAREVSEAVLLCLYRDGVVVALPAVAIALAAMLSPLLLRGASGLGAAGTNLALAVAMIGLPLACLGAFLAVARGGWMPYIGCVAMGFGTLAAFRMMFRDLASDMGALASAGLLAVPFGLLLLWQLRRTVLAVRFAGLEENGGRAEAASPPVAMRWRRGFAIAACVACASALVSVQMLRSVDSEATLHVRALFAEGALGGEGRGTVRTITLVLSPANGVAGDRHSLTLREEPPATEASGRIAFRIREQAFRDVDTHLFRTIEETAFPAGSGGQSASRIDFRMHRFERRPSFDALRPGFHHVFSGRGSGGSPYLGTPAEALAVRVLSPAAILPGAGLAFLLSLPRPGTSRAARRALLLGSMRAGFPAMIAGVLLIAVGAVWTARASETLDALWAVLAAAATAFAGPPLLALLIVVAASPVRARTLLAATLVAAMCAAPLLLAYDPLHFPGVLLQQSVWLLAAVAMTVLLLLAGAFDRRLERLCQGASP